MKIDNSKITDSLALDTTMSKNFCEVGWKLRKVKILINLLDLLWKYQISRYIFLEPTNKKIYFD